MTNSEKKGHEFKGEWSGHVGGFGGRKWRGEM